MPNIKYTICSLAIGEIYFNNIIKTFNDICVRTVIPNFVIVTDIMYLSTDSRIKIVNVGDHPITTLDKKFFNYNLKFLPIKESCQLNTDFVIYVDADWGMLDTYDEPRLSKLFNHMIENNIDFVFERPHTLGPGKNQGKECFWWHKIIPYELDKTTKYDTADVCNEQCLIFKNNNKLKIFVDFWEKMYKKCYELSVWPFAEGVEIGMSTIEANMKCDWRPMQMMGRTFYFYAKNGGYNERY